MIEACVKPKVHYPLPDHMEETISTVQEKPNRRIHIERLIRSIPFDPDRKAARQITEGIKGLISSGALRPGDLLPSIQFMASSFDVSTTTIWEVLKSLKKGTSPIGLQSRAVVTPDGSLAGTVAKRKGSRKRLLDIQRVEKKLRVLTIQPDPDLRLDQQLVKGIHQLVKEGGLNPGDPLPPKRRVAEIFDISTGTCAKAFQVLRRDGILTGKNSAGLLIATPAKKVPIPERPDAATDSPHIAKYIENIFKTIEIDPNVPTHMYRQFRDGVEKLIRDGHLTMGDWLPTINKMALLTNVGPSSVMMALHDLRRRRLVSTHFGIGTVVCALDPNTLASPFPTDPQPKIEIEKLFKAIKIDRQSKVPAGQQFQEALWHWRMTSLRLLRRWTASSVYSTNPRRWLPDTCVCGPIFGPRTTPCWFQRGEPGC